MQIANLKIAFCNSQCFLFAVRITETALRLTFKGVIIASRRNPARLALLLLPLAFIGRVAHRRGDAEKSSWFLSGARPGVADRLDHSHARGRAFLHPAHAQLAGLAMARDRLR